MSLSTPDSYKSKRLHGLHSHIEPTLNWPCSAAHTFDGHTTEHNSFSCRLRGSDGTSIQPGTKGRACVVLSMIHIYNVQAAVYKVLQTFSQRMTWVFCSTQVLLLDVNNIGQNMGEEIYSHTLFNRFWHYQCTNVLVPRKCCSFETDREPLPSSSSSV